MRADSKPKPFTLSSLFPLPDSPGEQHPCACVCHFKTPSRNRNKLGCIRRGHTRITGDICAGGRLDATWDSCPNIYIVSFSLRILDVSYKSKPLRALRCCQVFLYNFSSDKNFIYPAGSVLGPSERWRSVYAIFTAMPNSGHSLLCCLSPFIYGTVTPI